MPIAVVPTCPIPSRADTYCACGYSWSGVGKSCPSCGNVDHLPQFSAKDWLYIKGRGPLAVVDWPSMEGRPKDAYIGMLNRDIIIDSERYYLRGVESFAIPTVKSPVGLLVRLYEEPCPCGLPVLKNGKCPKGHEKESS